jgi:hypothetical protein
MPKPRSVPRTIRLIQTPAANQPGYFVITTGHKTDRYVFREIPCDIGGRGFALHRLGLGELYHARVGSPTDTSCECLGFLRHDHCKHLAGLRELIKRGKI